jgi:hypothetical protein
VSTNESWRRFLDAGTAVGAATLSRATEIAKGLMDAEPATRERARRDLDDLGRTGRQLGEQLAELAKSRLSGSLGHTGSIEETLGWISDLVSVRVRRHEARPKAREAADRLGGDGGAAPGSPAKHKKQKKKDKAAKGKHKEAKGKKQKQSTHKQRAKSGDGADRVLSFPRIADPVDRR